MYFELDQYSLAAKPIELRFGERTLSIATAFAWYSYEQKTYYLVTNWHNVTGINPLTGDHLSDSAGEPDRLVVHLDHRLKFGVRKPLGIMLRGESNQPLWLEHPRHGRRVDVVAIPFDVPETFGANPINLMTNVNMAEAVGRDAFILGYPFGIGPALLPIWKRASIASEPQIAVESLPYFFVDTASRYGMSGAPVIRREFGGYHQRGGHHLISAGYHSEFIGIYSSRIGAEDELKAQLGIVWRAQVVEEIIAAGQFGAIP